MNELPDSETFSRQWAAAVAARPAETFLIFEGPSGSVAEWTYGEFDQLVARVASFLVDNGVQKHSAVHLALTNSPSFVALWLAAVRLGAWIVPSDPGSSAPELADHIERTSPAIGVCASARADSYRSGAPTGSRILEVDEADVDLVWTPNREYGDWPQHGGGDRAAVMFTSGTTGRPKGVEITQANYAFAGSTMADAARLGPDDRLLVVLPLFHANAQFYSFAAAIAVGASVALMHTFSASGFMGQAARHEATCASLFAAPIRMILARGSPVDGVSLRHCWFAQNLSADQYATISAWLGCRPRQLYGMTETIPAVLTDEVAQPAHDTMGYLTDGCIVDLHDPSGSPVADGTIGEIVVGGDRGRHVFAGYLDDPETTASAFDGTWFRTGDRATRDASGRFRFEGRHSDVLKVGGENVSVVEIEAVLCEHPRVLEAAVVGAADAMLDEVPVAFVVASDIENAPTIPDLRSWCDDRLAKAKRPRKFTVVEELPRTSVGKIRKYALKEVDR